MRGSYSRTIQVADVGQTNFIPETPGIYILMDGAKLYCGSSQGLRTRTIESRGAQGFGKNILLFPSSFLSQPEQFSDQTLLRNFEAMCISSLFTIIWGNGLPVLLTNLDDAVILPEEAWSADEGSETDLAIKIAQSTLYLMGFPMHMVGLPCYDASFSSLRWEIMTLIKENLKDLIEGERKSRRNPDHPRSPLVPIGII